MAWFKVDDQLPDHRKFRTLGKDRLAATGLWVTTGAWCGSNLTDGFVPDEIVYRFDRTGKLAGRLVDVGLWTRDQVDGEPGYRFHDWDDHQPSKVDVEKRRRNDARRQQESRGRRRAETASRNGDGTFSPNGHPTSHGVTPGVTHGVTHPVDNSPVTDAGTSNSRADAHLPADPGADAPRRAHADARETHPHQQASDTRHGVTHTVSHPAPGPARPGPTPTTSSAAPAHASPDRARDSGGGHATALVHAWTEDHPGITNTRQDTLTAAVADLLTAGADPALIPAALNDAHTSRWRNPVKALPHAYEDVRRAQYPGPALAPTGTTGTGTSSQRAAAILAHRTGDGDTP